MRMWRVMAVSGVYWGQRARGKNADPGDLSLTDFITQLRVTVARESE